MFPEPTDAQREAIAEAARELGRLRSAWLNPPEWTREEVLEFPGSADGPWARYIDPATLNVPLSPQGRGARGEGPLPEGEGARVAIGTVRYPRTVPLDAECAKELKKRTLTNLYNTRPTWLELAHRKLDEAVFAAYGWDAGMSDDELLEKLLALNLARAGK